MYTSNYYLLLINLNEVSRCGVYYWFFNNITQSKKKKIMKMLYKLIIDMIIRVLKRF